MKPLITSFFSFLNLPLPYQKINNYIKKIAFTLAEVLITLGVIGVVAAMTIPTLITSYQKHVVETKLTKKNGNTWACKKDCTNCGYCTKWIQLNGWKIPKDYPW